MAYGRGGSRQKSWGACACSLGLCIYCNNVNLHVACQKHTHECENHMHDCSNHKHSAKVAPNKSKLHADCQHHTHDVIPLVCVKLHSSFVKLHSVCINHTSACR
jgi:hypothetical protein